MLNTSKFIAYYGCEMHNKFDERVGKRLKLYKFHKNLSIQWKIGFSHAFALLFYTHTCITLLSVLAELFAYEAAIVLVFQRSLVLSLDKDNIKSIQMFVGVSTSSKRYMYLYRIMKNQREFVFIKWERKFIQLSYHVYYL